MEQVLKFLIDGYPKGKYRKEELKQFFKEILNDFKEISYLAKNEKGSAEEVWNKIKAKGEVENVFANLVKKIDRVVVIYFASKFQNNEFVGTEIIKELRK